MGLLDELEQEAERRRNAEAQAAAAREKTEGLWRDKLSPAMERLAAYLKKLTEQLTYLQRRKRVVYALNGYGDIVAYIEPQFELRDAPAAIQHEITLEFIAQIASEECPTLDVEGVAKVRALSNAFQQHRLAGMAESKKGANNEVAQARFQARGKIPLKLTVNADRESPVVRMNFQNFEGLNSTTRTFAPDLLTDELFDSLGRFIAREETSFAKESVGEDVRRQLQSKIQRDHLKREWEDKLSRHLAEDEAQVLASMSGGGGPNSVLGRLRLAALKIIGK